MKNKIATLALVAILSGCATAPFVIGTAIQIGACELAQAKPEAQAPLLAAGLVFNSYSSTTAPTVEELTVALSQVLPGTDAATRIEINAFLGIIMAGYGPLYNSIESEADKANLRLWFGQVGGAFIAGSECRPTPAPAGAQAKASVKPTPTWVDLGKEVRASMSKVKK